jgi:hypothetical protein
MSSFPTFHPKFQRKATEAALVQAQILGHQMLPFMDAEPYFQTFMTYCKKCGMRAEIAAQNHTLCGTALTQKCDGQRARVAQMEDFMTGYIPALLLQRLQAEVDELEPELQARFDPGHFHGGSLCLCSDDGILAMRWVQPEDPEDPPLYPMNGGESGGFVELVQLVPASSIRSACYTGPRLNPKGHENSDEWLVLPLEPGEEGLAYPDSAYRWRFRRWDGVVGYVVDPRHLTLGKAVAAGAPGTRIDLLPPTQEGEQGDEGGGEGTGEGGFQEKSGRETVPPGGG